jgi:hypothetical protein
MTAFLFTSTLFSLPHVIHDRFTLIQKIPSLSFPTISSLYSFPHKREKTQEKEEEEQELQGLVVLSSTIIFIILHYKIIIYLLLIFFFLMTMGFKIQEDNMNQSFSLQEETNNNDSFSFENGEYLFQITAVTHLFYFIFLFA